jgi:hypothetical protein
MSLMLIVLTVSVLLGSWVLAIKPGNTLVSFNGLISSNTPTVGSVTITSDRSTTGDSTHYVTMTMPNHTQVQFSKISLTEQYRDQQAGPIPFDLTQTEAFAGTPEAMGSAIKTETWVDETGTIWVEFNPAIAAGSTLTVAFKAKSTSENNNYEYGIAAYPAVENPVAVFVGNGTLTTR